MLTAIDPDAPGYPPEAYGATPEQAAAWRDAANTSSRREIERPWGILMAMCLISALLLTYPQITSLFAGALTPNSERAYENTNIYTLHDELGLTGNGILVCIVDTGIEMTHPDLADANLVQYRDFIDGFIVDMQDKAAVPEIEKLDIAVKVTNTLMNDLNTKIELAKTVLNFSAQCGKCNKQFQKKVSLCGP